MKFEPKKTKFKYMHLPRRLFKRSANDKLVFGECGFQAVYSGTFTSKQMEIIRLIMLRYIKVYKRGYFLIRMFAHRQYSQRSPGTRMGSGKSPIVTRIALIKKNKIICEVKDMSEEQIKVIYRNIRAISGIKLRQVRKD